MGKGRVLPPVRVAIALELILLVVVLVFGYILLPKIRPAPASAEHVPRAIPVAGDPNAVDVHGSELYRADNQAFAAAAALSRTSDKTRPFIATVATNLGPQRVFIVPSKPTGPHRYELSELARLAPAAIVVDADRTATVKLPTIIGDGVTLVVDVAQTPVVRFLSTPDRYASLTGLKSTIDTRGSPGRPLQLTSVQQGTIEPDIDESDGRPFIRTKGGELDLRFTTVSHLGYHIGETSGVAWMSGGGSPATGGAQDSTFAFNHFGAYSSKARGLQIIRTRFANNRYYGFDPHTDTDGTVIRESAATSNGRHGIIFSKGCDDNVIESTSSVGNGGAGFMIDDGNPGLGETKTSNRNVMRSVVATDNGGPGAIIEGGDGNQVRDAQLTNNRIGYWVRGDASGSLFQNGQVAASLQTGVRIDGASVDTTVRDFTIDGALTGIQVGPSEDSHISNGSVTAGGSGVRVSNAAVDPTFHNVTVQGSGPRAVSGDGAPGGDIVGVTVTYWKTIQSRSMISNVIEYLVHPFAIITWSIILIPPTLAVLSRRFGLRRRQPLPPQ